MKKRIVSTEAEDATAQTDDWLDLDRLADVEITSEDAAHPIESALLPAGGAGWQAGGPGPQTIRLFFAQPQRIRRVWLEFIEPSGARTQEYVLRWSPDGGRTFHEVARQQWNFSPTGSTREVEDQQVDLDGVTVLELTIVPDVSGGNAPASLSRLRVA
jgi:hypothetical protein